MSRSQRLLQLAQLLRTYRYPVTAKTLAEKLQISVRSLYRDIATLQQQGMQISGSAGLGYQLQQDNILPPLMFDRHEVAALQLGLSWVKQQTDPQLAEAAQNAIAKIQAVIPQGLSEEIQLPAQLIADQAAEQIHHLLPIIRQAIQQRRKLQLMYQDQLQQSSQRTIWPVVCGYFESVRMLAAWCELRQDFRSFRLDRILDLQLSSECYPQTRPQLLKAWREAENIPTSQTY